MLKTCLICQKKAIKDIYDTETPTKGQTRKYKRYGKEFIPDLTGIYIHEYLVLSIIIDCTAPTAIEFRSKLRFN